MQSWKDYIFLSYFFFCRYQCPRFLHPSSTLSSHVSEYKFVKKKKLKTDVSDVIGCPIEIKKKKNKNYKPLSIENDNQQFVCWMNEKKNKFYLWFFENTKGTIIVLFFFVLWIFIEFFFRWLSVNLEQINWHK